MTSSEALSADMPYAPHVAGVKANRRWYVVQTRPREEDRAEQNLRRQAFEVFCPRMRHTVCHARRKTLRLIPVFPGYAFVFMDPDRTLWHAINGTFGVSRLLTVNQLPRPVPAGVIESLKSYVDSRGVMRPADDLRIGDRVRLISGPFAEMVGMLEYLDGRGRVRVLLQIMGGSTRVTADASALVAVN